MEPVIIIHGPEEDEATRVNKIFLSKINKRIEREEEIKSSLWKIIICQMNNLLSDELNRLGMKMSALKIDDSLLGTDEPYHWETVFIFAVPEEYDYNKIRKLFSEVKLPEVGGWCIPDELSKWSAAIFIYRGGAINISVHSDDEKCETITEKIKSIFKGNREIRIS